MKIRHLIIAACAAALSAGAFAANDAASAPKSDERASAPAKTMKPHNHMEEKGMVVPKKQEPASPPPSKSRHIHPRDAK